MRINRQGLFQQRESGPQSEPCQTAEGSERVTFASLSVSIVRKLASEFKFSLERRGSAASGERRYADTINSIHPMTPETETPRSLAVNAGSEFLRFHGERPEKYYAPGAEKACGNCKHLKPDYSHPCTDGRSILKQRGWICDCPELGCFSGWNEEGCCECHEPLIFPNSQSSHPED